MEEWSSKNVHFALLRKIAHAFIWWPHARPLACQTPMDGTPKDVLLLLHAKLSTSLEQYRSATHCDFTQVSTVYASTKLCWSGSKASYSEKRRQNPTTRCYLVLSERLELSRGVNSKTLWALEVLHWLPLIQRNHGLWHIFNLKDGWFRKLLG